MRIWKRIGVETIVRHRLFELRRESLASEIRHALVVAFRLFDLHRRAA